VSTSEIEVAQVGLDPAGKGGMAAVMRDLLASPLAERYGFEPIVTWRGFQPAIRLWVYCRALVSLAIWCLRPGRRVVHIHGAVRGSLYRKSLCVLLARLLRRPVLWQIHAGPGDIEAFVARLDRPRRWALGRALAAASRVVAVSRKSAQAMEDGFGVAGIGVVPNAAPSVSAADAAGVGEAVLFLGGFANPVKGGAPLVEALRRCAPELAGTSFELGGPGEPSEQLRALREQAPNVRWLGWLDEAGKRDAFRRCGLFVLPSLSEGLPVALLEAMAWGRPILATRVGGVPEVVADGSEARIVEPGAPAVLAAAIVALVADRDGRLALGRAARERALTLNDEEVCGRLDAIYRELAG
jgi:glycosyltransferase involved in cell wall biosynthesis